MAVGWPAVSQAVLSDSYSISPEDNVNRFEADVGPPVSHSRTITANNIIAWQMDYTPADYDTLEAWWRDDLKNGLLPFQRDHPHKTGQTGEFVFRQNGFRMVGVVGLHFRVSFQVYQQA